MNLTGLHHLSEIPRRQNGAALLVAMFMLLMMTMLAISSINLSTVNLKIVGNMQWQKEMDAAAQDAIEQVLSQYSLFTSPAATTVVTAFGNVQVDQPVCISTNEAPGYTAVITGTIPNDNIWDVKAAITDSLTGATTTMHQGVSIRMLAGNCPNPP
ncbi:MAG: hypothetical protein ACRESK_04870 [Gammaproteobacteria bacterium]